MSERRTTTPGFASIRQAERVKPFSDKTPTAELLQRWLTTTPLGHIDPDGFPDGISLKEILIRDARHREFKPGDLVMAKGDYGNSAFFIIKGELHVLLGDDFIAQEHPAHSGGWKLAMSQLLTSCRPRPKRHLHRHYSVLAEASLKGPQVVPNYQEVIMNHSAVKVGAGEVVGEIAVLTRAPRSASLVAGSECELLEVRWQGLRDLRKYSDEFRGYIDRRYRERTLEVMLRQIPLFEGLSKEQLKAIAEQSHPENYGRFDWYTSFNLTSEENKNAAMNESPIVTESRYADGLLLITSGFARVAQSRHNGQATTRFLRAGDLFGGHELYQQWKRRKEAEKAGKELTLREMNPGWSHSLYTIGYVDLLRIPTKLVEECIFGGVKESHPQLAPLEPEDSVDQGLIEFLTEHRYINGREAMVIDLQRCVRCDDCVRACSVAHDGDPYFVREGRTHGRYQVTRACMHCHDPVCMIGCPTGAIRRATNGLILIEGESCIGCGNCAGSCPFKAINMVELDPTGGPDGGPLLRANKCDLCADQLVSPQCEQACPHGALKRLNLADLTASARWLK